MAEGQKRSTRSAKAKDSDTQSDLEGSVETESTIIQASASSAFTFTPELLKSILESQAQCTADAIARQAQSNANAMERILAKFAPSASPALSITSDSGASGSSSSVTTTTKVKVPPWTDDQKPQAYFLNFEKAKVCNGEP